jgi:acyl carrier protein
MPAHLIPSLLIACDDIPLGPTGKTDRARLAELIPPTSAPATGTQDHTPEQQVVSEVWAELLGGHAGLDTNFFDAGGDSLALQRLRLRLAEVTGAHIDMVALFEHTTVRTQAAFVHELTGRYPPLLTGRQE